MKRNKQYNVISCRYYYLHSTFSSCTTKFSKSGNLKRMVVNPAKPVGICYKCYTVKYLKQFKRLHYCNDCQIIDMVRCKMCQKWSSFVNFFFPLTLCYTQHTYKTKAYPSSPINFLLSLKPF